MNRAYKYRAYPTPRQQRLLARVFGSYRYVYNWALAERQREYTMNGVTVPWGVMSGRLTELKHQPETEWLNEVGAQILQQALQDCQRAYENFFQKRAKFPRFKKRKSKQSARFPNQSVRVTDRGVKLGKGIGEVKLNWHRPLPDDYKLNSMTISRDAAGHWWVSLSVEENNAPAAPVTNSAVGVDAGLTSLVALSTGEKITNPRHERRDRVRLARAQRKLSRKQPGSKNREKQRRRVAKIYARITDRRRDFLHKLTTRLVHENQVIAIEDLSVRNMQKNHSLARSISDASWSELRRQLEYKCEWYGRELRLVDRWYPSSKTCSACGHLLTALPLAVREWTCPSCGVAHDRDVNAARNILAAGSAVTASGAGVRPRQQPLPTQAALKEEAATC